MASLSQLLAVGSLGLELVQAGADDPELSWVATTELLDLSGYVAGGELILTLGLSLSADDERWLDFVASLARARVAAIGFGVGVHHARVPEPLVRACSSYRVALVVVPLPTAFIAVSKAVAQLLRADELRQASLALEGRRQLFAAAREGYEPARVLAALCEATGRQVAVLRGGVPLYCTAGFAAASEVDVRRVGLDIADGLELAVAGGGELSVEGRGLVAVGALLLGVSLGGGSFSAGVDGRVRGFWERLGRAVCVGELPFAAVRVLDPGLVLPERVRVVAVQGPAAAVASWRRRVWDGCARLLWAEPGAAASPGLGLVWQVLEDDAVRLDVFCGEAAALGLAVVVGRAVECDFVSVCARGVRACLGGLPGHAASYVAGLRRIVFVEALSPFFELLRGDERGLGVARAVLGGLCGEGDEFCELRRVLRVFLECGGSVGLAASRLGLHRNTVRARLRRVRELCGFDPVEPAAGVELLFALRLYAAEQEDAAC